ncbi:MAG: glycosyltransferase family 39 protein, partial [Chloroflexi bacterium]|nr:glycosyltransferase family 39 protein [Chloroflexota bacterium]
AALELVNLQAEAFGNTYYAAAVQSMLASWHNFFFVSSDLGGFVSVDKPPLGLWIQVLSAKLLGFNGVALLLPQALAGIASVALLYWLVRRVHGGAAGLIAAAALAVMPISVVTARNNTMDATLVLTLLVAAWLVSLAAESGRLSLLLLSAAVVGLAFNIKMLQAYLVVPGYALAYFFFAPLTWRRKLVDLSAAGAVLLVVSLAWCVAVDLTPASMRPYVGSSGSNSAIALALTYNGLGRVTQAIAPWLTALHISVPLDLDNMPGMAPGIGNPSLSRLFTPSLAGQASWLLAPALLGTMLAAAALWLARRDRSGQVRSQAVAVMVWGGWLLACGAYFSFARFYHTYYLTMLGPAIAALVGIGLIVLWRAYVRGEPLGWGLPLVLWASGVLQVHFTSASSQWQTRLEPWILATTIGASLILIGARLVRTSVSVQGAAMSIAVVGLLIAPTVWSVTSVQNGAGGAWLPSASPGGAGFGPGNFGGPPSGGFGAAPGGNPRSGGFGNSSGNPPANGVGGSGGGPSAGAATSGSGGASATGGSSGASTASAGSGASPASGDFGARAAGGSGGSSAASNNAGATAAGGNGGASAASASGGASTPSGTGGSSAAGGGSSAGAGNGGAGAPSGGSSAAATGGGAPTGFGRGAPGGFARGGGGQNFGGGPGGGGVGAMTFAGQNWDPLDSSLVTYLESQQGTTTYLAATATSSYASVLTLLTNQPVMALGGYQGWDRILDPTQLAVLVHNNTIRFFLLSANSTGGRGQNQDATADLTAWVEANCSASTWQGQTPGDLQLYDCASPSS